MASLQPLALCLVRCSLPRACAPQLTWKLCLEKSRVVWRPQTDKAQCVHRPPLRLRENTPCCPGTPSDHRFGSRSPVCLCSGAVVRSLASRTRPCSVVGPSPAQQCDLGRSLEVHEPLSSLPLVVPGPTQQRTSQAQNSQTMTAHFHGQCFRGGRSSRSFPVVWRVLDIRCSVSWLSQCFSETGVTGTLLSLRALELLFLWSGSKSEPWSQSGVAGGGASVTGWTPPSMFAPCWVRGAGCRVWGAGGCRGSGSPLNVFLWDFLLGGRERRVSE